jgi:hypothetical protein
MGDLYSLFTKYAPAKILAEITESTGIDVNNILSDHGVDINPIGAINLTSTSNRIVNLDAAWVGSDGFDFVDHTNLTVGTIGGSDNTNYGQIDEPAMGPVTITTTGNLTLTNVMPDTGVASGLPVIATSGEGANITLTVGGVFTNLDNTEVVALDPTGGANYVIYSQNPAEDRLGNLTPTVVFNTPPGTTPPSPGNVIAYPGTGTVTPVNPTPTMGVNSPGDPNSPVLPVNNTLYTIRTVTLITPGTVTQDTSVIGGAGGVATDDDLGGPNGQGNKLPPITKNDVKDGSTVNTGTLGEKWVANTGLSTIIRVGDSGFLFGGRLFPGGTPPSNFDLFNGESSQQILGELSSAAFGSGAGGHH